MISKRMHIKTWKCTSCRIITNGEYHHQLFLPTNPAFIRVSQGKVVTFVPDSVATWVRLEVTLETMLGITGRAGTIARPGPPRTCWAPSATGRPGTADTGARPAAAEEEVTKEARPPPSSLTGRCSRSWRRRGWPSTSCTPPSPWREEQEGGRRGEQGTGKARWKKRIPCLMGLRISSGRVGPS